MQACNDQNTFTSSTNNKLHTYKQSIITIVKIKFANAKKLRTSML